jgi:2-hydroxychromene-2-carboxylate isomerase
VFNPTKKVVGQAGMSRTLKRYKIKYNPPLQHPRKSVNALRLLYCVDGEERKSLTEALFKAYWVTGRDITSTSVLLDIAQECGIAGLSESNFADPAARKELENATAEAIERGAFGVPGFWIPDARWTDFNSEKREGRFFWNQDRMHFVEAAFLSLASQALWSSVPALQSLMPRCHRPLPPRAKTKLQFWYDFSSPWAFLGYTQLARLQHQYDSNLEIEMKPFLLGILFREIGAPNLPMAAVSPAKALWLRQDHADWVNWWNSVNAQVGKRDKVIEFQWADVFPIRTPTVLRVAIAAPETTALLCESRSSCERVRKLTTADSACWEHNADVSQESVFADVLTKGGYSGADSIATANKPEVKAKLRGPTAEA